MLTRSDQPASEFVPGTILQRTPRLLRFASVGGTCALLQLATLRVLVGLGTEKSIANFVTLIAFAQLNFALSSFITWTERRECNGGTDRVVHRLARFNGMIMISALANQATFLLAAPHFNYLLSGVFALLAGSIINFVVSDRLVFVASPI